MIGPQSTPPVDDGLRCSEWAAFSEITLRLALFPDQKMVDLRQGIDDCALATALSTHAAGSGIFYSGGRVVQKNAFSLRVLLFKLMRAVPFFIQNGVRNSVTEDQKPLNIESCSCLSFALCHNNIPSMELMN